MFAMPRFPALRLASLLTLACTPDVTSPSAGSTGATTHPGTTTTTGPETSDDNRPTGTSADTTGTSTGTTTGPSPLCDPLLQDCPAGFKCTGVKPTLEGPYTGTACVPDNAGGGATPGSICLNAPDGADTCGPDSMCVQFGSGEGACVAFCTGNTLACADPQQVCARTDTQWSLYLCVPPCDPLAYDCPDLDFGADVMVCAPATIGFGCLLRGHLFGSPFAAPCVNHRDCTAAAHCAPQGDMPGCAAASGCCDVYCDTSEPALCPLAAEGQVCVPYYAPGEAPPGLEDVGVCAVP